MADPKSLPQDRGLFSERRALAGEGATPDAGLFPERPFPAVQTPQPKKAKARWIVPLILFVVIIGGIAWLAQNMPSWQSPQQRPVAPAPKGQILLLGFFHPYTNNGYITAMWERPAKTDKQPYQVEVERGAMGQYAFPFGSHPDQDVEIGLVEMSCDCAKLHVALITKAEADAMIASIIKAPEKEPAENAAWIWHELEKSADKGVALPVGSYGVLRMRWTNRRLPGESLNLKARLWARQGTVKQQDYGVQVPAVSAAPLRTKSDRANVGTLEPGGVGKAAFVLWSPTRAQAKLALPEAAADPLLTIDVKPFSEADCADLQVKLRNQDINTRVRAAWQVDVLVKENQGDRYLDQGHFLRQLSLQLADAADEMAPLTITGLVKGPVEIGGLEDQGKINLKSFPAQNGTKKTIYLWTDHKTGLAFQAAQPGALEVRFQESVKEKSPTKRKWELQVVVPPNQLFGTITEESAIILQTDAKPPRLIRIPLMGHAVQG